MADDAKAPKRPFWMPDTQGFLAVAIIGLISLVVLILLTRPPQIDERTSGVLMTIVGVLIACLKDVYSFFFGSSKGSDAKTDTQNKIMEKLTSPPPNGPVAPVPSPLVTPTPWWSLLNESEKSLITVNAANDPRVQAFITTASSGHGASDDLAYLVTKGLLTPERSAAIQGG